MRRAHWLLLVLLGGCSLGLPFDPEAQPCDPRATSPDTECAEGYECEREGSSDAGVCKEK